jgi:hypothetical protein
MFCFVEKIQDHRPGPSASRSIWFEVREPVGTFTGREAELQDLHDFLTRSSESTNPTVINQSATISGLGGIGKSELARKYAAKYVDYYKSNAIWINAETLESFQTSLSKLAELYFPKAGKSATPTVILQQVFDRFSSQKCLLIFDNVEGIKVLDYLPKSCPPKIMKPYVLITSRLSEWDLGVKVLNLGVLSHDEAVLFVKKCLNFKTEEEESVDRLISTLQCLPLALQQAVAYIRSVLQLYPNILFKNTLTFLRVKIENYLPT